MVAWRDEVIGQQELFIDLHLTLPKSCSTSANFDLPHVAAWTDPKQRWGPSSTPLSGFPSATCNFTARHRVETRRCMLRYAPDAMLHESTQRGPRRGWKGAN